MTFQGVIMSSIERRIDKLGRVVLPISYRERLKLSDNSKVRIWMDETSIIITPSELCCSLCGSKLRLHKDVSLCFDCINKIKKL